MEEKGGKGEGGRKNKTAPNDATRTFVSAPMPALDAALADQDAEAQGPSQGHRARRGALTMSQGLFGAPETAGATANAARASSRLPLLGVREAFFSSIKLVGDHQLRDVGTHSRGSSRLTAWPSGLARDGLTLTRMRLPSRAEELPPVSPSGRFHVQEKEEGSGTKSLLLPRPGGAPRAPSPWAGPRDGPTAPRQGAAPAWPLREQRL